VLPIAAINAAVDVPPTEVIASDRQRHGIFTFVADDW
jgi:hypothetical protein